VDRPSRERRPHAKAPKPQREASASAGRGASSAFSPILCRFRRTWRAGIRIHAYISQRSSRPLLRPYRCGAQAPIPPPWRLERLTAAAAARLRRCAGELCRRRGPTTPEARDKTLRRFTRAQVQPRQDHPAAPRGATHGKANYVAKNVLRRQKSLRQKSPRHNSADQPPRQRSCQLRPSRPDHLR
jgi:hypothetical protein